MNLTVQENPFQSWRTRTGWQWMHGNSTCESGKNSINHNFAPSQRTYEVPHLERAVVSKNSRRFTSFYLSIREFLTEEFCCLGVHSHCIAIIFDFRSSCSVTNWCRHYLATLHRSSYVRKQGNCNNLRESPDKIATRQFSGFVTKTQSGNGNEKSNKRNEMSRGVITVESSSCVEFVKKEGKIPFANSGINSPTMLA